jgi:hypothetical protein
MAITKIPAAGFTGNNFRNIIINGDMSIAQRGTSTSSITTSGYYTTDRWLFNIGSAGTWTQSQSTDVPSGQGFAKSLKLDCTTADASLSAGDNIQLQQRIEGQNLQYLKKGTSSAESLTMSFWVKSNKTGTYIVEIDDNDNSRNINKSYTIDSADTWEKKIITFAGDTSGTLGNDNGDSLRLIWWLGAGSTFTSGTLATSWESTTNANRAVGQVNLADSTSNELYITGVQLEAGTSASDFEFLPVDVNLGRCQRYYQNSNDSRMDNLVFNNYSVDNAYGSISFNKTMRASPTVTFPGTLNTDITAFSNGASRTITAITAAYATTDRLSINLTFSPSVTQGYATHINNPSGFPLFKANAEL